MATKKNRTIGSRIAELVHRRGLTVIDFAGRLGVSRSQTHNYLSGYSEVSADRLKQIAAVLECKPEHLLQPPGSRIPRRIPHKPPLVPPSSGTSLVPPSTATFVNAFEVARAHISDPRFRKIIRDYIDGLQRVAKTKSEAPQC